MKYLVILIICSGCESYKHTGWYTPDTFGYSYTSPFHHSPGVPPTHTIDFGWTLK